MRTWPLRVDLNRTSDCRVWVRFALVVGTFGILTIFLYRYGHSLWQTLAPLDVATAQLTATLIRWSGLEVDQVGPAIRHANGFAFEIYYRCTGLIPVLFVLIGLAALPGHLRSKVRAAGIAAISLLALNQIRLVSLFWIGVRHPQAFGMAHEVVWETAMILAILLVWLLWLESLDGGAGKAVRQVA